MNLRSLLHRKQVHKGVPLLPPESDDSASVRKRTKPPNEERLERLLTPSELDLVQHHRL